MLEVLNQFKNITFWQAGGKRAPNKPLLLLLAIGEFLNKNKILNYADIEEQLRNLLYDFGPSRRVIHPEYPFIFLANDNIWDIKSEAVIDTKKTYSSAFLKRNSIKGGFNEDVQKALRNKKFREKIIRLLLEENFAPSLHNQILNATGLTEYQTDYRTNRDPKFRDRVLAAYGYKCAVCDYGIRLTHQLVGVEAAHIKWVKAGGPNDLDNGIALCSLHHLLLDSGGFTIDKNLKINTSVRGNGNGVEEWLHRFDGENLFKTKIPDGGPNPEYLDWHMDQVFKKWENN